MTTKLWNADNTDLSRFQLFTAKNNILEFDTAAMRVTEKNIGHLAIYFETDLYRRSENGLPYFSVTATREKSLAHASLSFSIGDVLFFLRGEIHKFDETTFNHTFTTDELIEYRCSFCGKISGDNKDGAYKEQHAAMVMANGVLSTRLVDCNMDLKV